MRTFHDYRLVSESFESQCKARRYNPATVLRMKHKGVKRRFVLGCGSNDNVTVLREGDLLFVVSVNHGLEYAGLEVFDLGEVPDEDQHGPMGIAFLQADYEIAEILGPRGVDLTPITIAKRLADYALQ